MHNNKCRKLIRNRQNFLWKNLTKRTIIYQRYTIVFFLGQWGQSYLAEKSEVSTNGDRPIWLKKAKEQTRNTY